MIYALLSLSPAFDVAWWALLIVFSVAVYWAVRLPSLPWIAAHLAIAVVAVPVSQWLFRSFIPQPLPQSLVHPMGSPLHYAVITASALASIIDLLVMLMILAEVGRLIQRAYPDVSSRVVLTFARVHPYVRRLGIVVVVLTICFPVPALVYYWTHSSAAQ